MVIIRLLLEVIQSFDHPIRRVIRQDLRITFEYPDNTDLEAFGDIRNLELIQVRPSL